MINYNYKHYYMLTTDLVAKNLIFIGKHWHRPIAKIR